MTDGVAEKIREEIKNVLASNENENTIYENLHDTTKTDQRGKCIGECLPSCDPASCNSDLGLACV